MKERKEVIIKCRVTESFNKKLTEYCKENLTTKSSVILSGIKKVTGIKESRNKEK